MVTAMEDSTGINNNQQEVGLHHQNSLHTSSPGGARAATMGGLYALLLTVLGFMLPIIFFMEGQNKSNGLYLAVFHIYVYAVSLFFLLYLQCCLMTKRRKKAGSIDECADSMDFDMLEDTHGFKDTLPLPSRDVPDVESTLPVRGDAPRPLREFDKDDDGDSPPFSYSGEGVNFLFRFGVIVLGMGSVILDGFRLLQFVETKAAWLCYGDFFLVDTVLRLVFVFAETFFIFKNHKLIVNFKTGFIRFGLVHLVATNLCVLAMVVVMETVEAFRLLKKDDPSDGPVVLPTEGPSGYIDGPLFMNVSLQIHRICHGRYTLADKAASYLYPTAVQFSVMAAAVVAKIFMNVGGSTWRLPRVPSQRRGSFCHKANTGLFLGLIVVVLTLIVTCFFLLDRAGHLPLDRLITTLVFFCNDLAVLAVSLLVVLIAFCKMRRLRSDQPGDRLHQVLQFMGVSGYYAFYVCVLIPAVGAVIAGGEESGGEELLNSQLLVVVCALAGTQASVQVTFVIDAIRRRAATRQHLKTKPGRSLVTFLMICNLAMWIIDSFQMKELHTSAMLLAYYGDLPWQILIHVFLPLAVLFRFHSAICFADVFSRAYKKRPSDNLHNMSFTHSEPGGDADHRVQHIG